MTALIGWLIFLAVLSFYGTVGMLLGVAFYRAIGVGCNHKYCMHDMAAVFGGLFWPLGVWLLGGILLATKPERDAVRVEQKAQSVRQLERDAGVRCYHDEYAAECYRCKQVKR